MADPKAIKQRYDQLYNAQSNFRNLWQELAEFIMPRRARITLRRSVGSKTHSIRQFDSAAEHASSLLASNLQGTLTSDFSQWFDLVAHDEDLNDIQEVQYWCEQARNLMLSAFYASNMQSEIHEAYLDITAFGNAAILLEENEVKKAGFNGFRFQAWPVGEYVMDEGYNGLVDAIYRKFDMSVRAIIQQFGEKNVDPRILQKNQTTPHELMPVIHAIYPRADEDKKGYDKPYASCYLDYTFETVLRDGGYEEFPVMAPRWSKLTGEVYGRGQGEVVLADIRSMNKARQFGFEAWALDLRPPLAVMDDGVIGRVRWVPGGQIPVRDMANRPQPINTGARYDVSQIKFAELEERIRKGFFNDLLQMPNKSYLTATEVNATIENNNRILGPHAGRLQAELLTPLINRAFNIMYRSKAFPPAPEALSGKRIDVRYQGPLARAGRLQDVQAMEHLFLFTANVAKARPDVLDNFDYDLWIRDVAEKLGTSAKYVLSQDKIAALRQQRMQMQQQETKKQDMLGAAQAAGQAAPMMKNIQDAMQGQAA